MDKMKFETPNLTAENVTKIAELFPGVVTEGKVNIDLLRSMLGDEVYGDEEYTGWLMENNFPLLDTFVFDAGVVLQTPAPPEQTAANDLPIWRSKV